MVFKLFLKNIILEIFFNNLQSSLTEPKVIIPETKLPKTPRLGASIEEFYVNKMEQSILANQSV